MENLRSSEFNVAVIFNQALITNFNPKKVPDNLVSITFGNSNLESFNLPYSPNSLLEEIDLQSCQLTGFKPDYLPVKTLFYLGLGYNNLSTEAVNETLIYLDSLNFTNIVDLYLQQRIPAPPSGDGLIAKASLIAKGWSVETD